MSRIGDHIIELIDNGLWNVPDVPDLEEMAWRAARTDEDYKIHYNYCISVILKIAEQELNSLQSLCQNFKYSSISIAEAITIAEAIAVSAIMENITITSDYIRTKITSYKEERKRLEKMHADPLPF